MADISGPGGMPTPDPLHVSRVQEVKPGRDTPEQIIQKNPQGVLFAGFCAFVKKKLQFLIQSSTKKRGTLSGGGLEHHLLEFKKNLQVLTTEDQSQNQTYILRLSGEWHSLLEAFNLVEFLERKKSPLIVLVKAFLESFRTYPPSQEHSLGFYMSEFAGKKGVPFPFTEILHNLHDDYNKNKERSQLFQWISSIDQLLSDLTRK